MSVQEKAGIPARRAAFHLLEDVLYRDRDLDDAAQNSQSFQALGDARDRAFARATVLTVLRRLGQLDALIGEFLERPLKGNANRAAHLLRIGLAHLLFMDVAPHAAVDPLVSLARGESLTPQAGMINAVLRRATREGASLIAGQDAARLNTPQWLWDDWTARFGVDTARAIAAAHLCEPPLDLTVRADASDWAARLGGTLIGRATVRLNGAGAVRELPGFDDGAWWVQDHAASLPAHLLGPDLTGKRVVDLCAAPGGKTAQLIAAGAQVTAVDRSKPRLKRLEENLSRLGMAAEVVQVDGAVWRPDTPADAVLLDAPCSATGTLRRHPEIACRRNETDVAKLANTQKRLLTAAAEMLKPGGVLVVATCSLQTAEGPALFDAARDLPTLSVDPIRPEEFPGLDGAVQPDGWAQTHPAMLADRGHLDGFFMARFLRRD